MKNQSYLQSGLYVKVKRTGEIGIINQTFYGYCIVSIDNGYYDNNDILYNYTRNYTSAFYNNELAYISETNYCKIIESKQKSSLYPY